MSLQKIRDRITNDKQINLYDSYIKNYLYAIILWDDVYALNKRGSMYVGSPPKNMLEFDSKLGIKRINYEYGLVESIADAYEYENYGTKTNWESCTEEDRVDAIFYLILGHNLGMNVLLSDKRTEFIKKAGILQKIYTREDLLEQLDKGIQEYCDEINAKIGKKFFTIKFPVLLDYIYSNIENPEDIIEAKNIALRIKEDPEVIRFRKTMDLMDEAINNKNLVEFKNYIDVIPEIINSINCNGLKTKTMDVGISFSPSLTIPFEIGKLGLKKKMINMNFFVDLAKYKLQGKRIDFGKK